MYHFCFLSLHDHLYGTLKTIHFIINNSNKIYVHEKVEVTKMYTAAGKEAELLTLTRLSSCNVHLFCNVQNAVLWDECLGKDHALNVHLTYCTKMLIVLDSTA